MSTLGKILLVLNFLAAAGLIYVATQDWARRQEVTSSALRFQLLKNGLPFEVASSDTASDTDSVATRIELPGGIVVDSIRPELLQLYFQGADGGSKFASSGGTPPATQLDEIRRIQGILEAMLAQASPNQKLQLLCGQPLPDGSFVPGLLIRLADSSEERDLARRLADPSTAEVDAAPDVSEAAVLAETLLKKRFETVLSPPNPQVAQQQAEELASLNQQVDAAFAPLREALETLKTVTDTALQAQTAALMNPDNPSTQQELATAQSRLREAVTAVKSAADRLRAARQPLYQALTRPTPTAAHDESDRRRRAAHLLIFLDESAPWQQRVARIVGLNTYKTVLAAQVERTKSMLWTIEQQIRADQALFTSEYEQLKQLALDRQGVLDQQIAVTAGLAVQVAKDEELLKLRQRQRDERQQLLSELQAQVQTQLKQQAMIEDALFQVQQQVGATLNANFDLETELEKRERQAMQGRRAPIPGKSGL
jgi:hypothetical protein